MEFPAELRYSAEHEWVRVEGNEATVGITAFAQDQLGDVVFVELPEVGRTVRAGEALGVVESVKSVSDVFSPVSGTVVRVNDALRDKPELINEEPYGKGWIAVLRLSQPEEVGSLMTAEAYREKVGA